MTVQAISTTRTALRSQFAACILLAAAMVTSPAGAEEATCGEPQNCRVAGAETDDDATIKARSVPGTGPKAGVASDRRLKQEIRKIGSLPNGLPVYSFRFQWEERVRVGLVAQDLLEHSEGRQAVLTLSNGLYGIDYASLGLRMATEVEWMAHGYDALKADYFAPETLAEEQLPRFDNGRRR